MAGFRINTENEAKRVRLDKGCEEKEESRYNGESKRGTPVGL